MTQNPCPTKFVGDMQDLILASSDSVEFQLKVNNTLVLKETYNPSEGSIRIGGLEKVLDTCLYGELKRRGGQDHLGGSVSMLVDGTSVVSKTMYGSHQVNSNDPNGEKTILSHGLNDVCYPGFFHPLTFIGAGSAKLYDADGDQLGSTMSVGVVGSVYTEDCDPAQLFPNHYEFGSKIVYTCGTDTFTSYIDHRSYADGNVLMFLNMYDAPEALLSKVALQVKPQSTDDVGTSYGESRRYHIEQNDEYTVDSGALLTRSEYSQWRDLVMSRRVSILWERQWIPIIVTKVNYSHTLRMGSYAGVGFTFRMARERDNGRISL